MPQTAAPTLCSITMCSTPDKAANLRTAFDLMNEAVIAGADWLLLPEMFSCLGDRTRILAAAEAEDGPLNDQLAAFSKKHQVVVMAGSLPEQITNNDKVYNTCYTFGRDGHLLAKYRKTHLFRLENDQGEVLHSEGETFCAGDDIVRCQIDGYEVGFGICYDLRFSGFFQKMNANQPIDVLVMPAAFTAATGAAHWELLLKARAIELQAYVFSANQTGQHSSTQSSFGHSMLVDPWGTVVCQTTEKPGRCQAAINHQTIARYRKRLSVLKNSRSDLYG